MIHFNYVLYLDSINAFNDGNANILDLGAQNLLGIDEKLALLFFVVDAGLLYADAYTYKEGWYDWFNMLGLAPKNLAQYTVGLGVGMFFLLLALVNSKLLGKVFSLRPGRKLGAISYSLFLSHTIYLYALFPEFTFAKVIEHADKSVCARLGSAIFDFPRGIGMGSCVIYT